MSNHLKYLNRHRFIALSDGMWWPVRCKLRSIFYVLLLIGCVSLFAACTPDPPPTLNYKDRQFVDSLFRKEIDSLKPLLDSLCDVRFDSSVQVAVDSILLERQTEKEKYLERVKRELGGQ